MENVQQGEEKEQDVAEVEEIRPDDEIIEVEAQAEENREPEVIKSEKKLINTIDI